jgi:ABC-type uncharacterized transport system permease subunit
VRREAEHGSANPKPSRYICNHSSSGLPQKPLSALQSLAVFGTVLLSESIRVDPGNFIVRYKYFATLQTRWGGSLEQMLEFEQQARAAGLSPTQLKYFASLIGVERKWLQQQRGR